jgi:hypothetical protein
VGAKLGKKNETPNYSNKLRVKYKLFLFDKITVFTNKTSFVNIN